MNRQIEITPLTAEEFAPFGDVIEVTGPPDMCINQGKCDRFHDRAALDFSDGRAAVSLFHAQLRRLPYTLDLIERHPLGSQCFVPMTADPFLVIVSTDPQARPLAFLTSGTQAINFHKNTWHGVLTPLEGNGLFCVIDRIGEGTNLVEHVFETPWEIVSL